MVKVYTKLYFFYKLNICVHNTHTVSHIARFLSSKIWNKILLDDGVVNVS